MFEIDINCLFYYMICLVYISNKIFDCMKQVCDLRERRRVRRKRCGDEKDG